MWEHLRIIQKVVIQSVGIKKLYLLFQDLISEYQQYEEAGTGEEDDHCDLDEGSDEPEEY